MVTGKSVSDTRVGKLNSGEPTENDQHCDSNNRRRKLCLHRHTNEAEKELKSVNRRIENVTTSGTHPVCLAPTRARLEQTIRNRARDNDISNHGGGEPAGT